MKRNFQMTSNCHFLFRDASSLLTDSPAGADRPRPFLSLNNMMGARASARFSDQRKALLNHSGHGGYRERRLAWVDSEWI